MNITDVRIRLLKKGEAKLKAVATITIDDCFVVHDIKILEGEKECFIAMPSKKTPSGEFKDIVHPINTETREKLNKLIVEEYYKALKESESANVDAS